MMAGEQHRGTRPLIAYVDVLDIVEPSHDALGVETAHHQIDQVIGSADDAHGGHRVDGHLHGMLDEHPSRGVACKSRRRQQLALAELHRLALPIPIDHVHDLLLLLLAVDEPVGQTH